jgi:hypothetical protein
VLTVSVNGDCRLLTLFSVVLTLREQASAVARNGTQDVQRSVGATVQRDPQQSKPTQHGHGDVHEASQREGDVNRDASVSILRAQLLDFLHRVNCLQPTFHYQSMLCI